MSPWGPVTWLVIAAGIGLCLAAWAGFREGRWRSMS